MLANVNGATLYYELLGDGPPLMLMHGDSASTTPTSDPGSTPSPKTSRSSSTTTGATDAQNAHPTWTTCFTQRGPTTPTRSGNTSASTA